MIALLPTSWLMITAASAADSVVGANGLATGSAVVAHGTDNAGITVNPGLLALYKRYDLHAHLRYGASSGMQWAVSVLDARTSEVVALGLTYSGDRYEPVLTSDELPGWSLPGQDVDNVKRHHDFSLGLAAQALDRTLSFGVAGNLGWYNHDRQGTGLQGDLDLGVGLHPSDPLTFGVSAQNVLPLAGIVGRDLTVLGGVRVASDRVGAIEIDGGVAPAVVDSPLVLAAGGEAYVGTGRLRAGWRLDGGVHTATAGVGVETSGGAVEYGLGVPLVDGAGLGTTVHQVSIRFGAPSPIPEE